MEALRLWNQGKGSWCTPRRGTPEHAEVKRLMGKDTAKVEMAKEEMKAVKKALKKKRAIKISDQPEEDLDAPMKKRKAIKISDEPEEDLDKEAAKAKLKRFLQQALAKRKMTSKETPKTEPAKVSSYKDDLAKRNSIKREDIHTAYRASTVILKEGKKDKTYRDKKIFLRKLSEINTQFSAEELSRLFKDLPEQFGPTEMENMFEDVVAKREEREKIDREAREAEKKRRLEEPKVKSTKMVPAPRPVYESAEEERLAKAYSDYVTEHGTWDSKILVQKEKINRWAAAGVPRGKEKAKTFTKAEWAAVLQKVGYSKPELDLALYNFKNKKVTAYLTPILGLKTEFHD
jgi:hypothetical protein